MESSGVYNLDKLLNDELSRLDNENISDTAKVTIRKFVKYLSVESNLTEHRQYFYLVRLRVIARQMGVKFLSPEKDDIIDLVETLKNVKTMRGKGYSANTMRDFFRALKRFYTWYDNGKYLDSVNWIKTKILPSHTEKPENVITRDELNRMLYACQNTRDKALISLLYDSGCRISELLTLQIKDVEFDECGASIHVNGKTGPRWVRVVGDSVPALREHIGPRSAEEYVFQGLEGDAKGKVMNYYQVSKVLRSILKRAEINRRIHPHLFRHTRATLLASNMKEAPLEAQMGWRHGSRMTQTYVHFSRTDLDNAVLRAYGIERPDTPSGTGEPLPKKCERCSLVNESDAKFCKRCGLPLERELLSRFDEGMKFIKEVVLKSLAVSDQSKTFVGNFDQNFVDKALEAALMEVYPDPEKREILRKDAEKLRRGK